MRWSDKPDQISCAINLTITLTRTLHSNWSHRGVDEFADLARDLHLHDLGVVCTLASPLAGADELVDPSQVLALLGGGDHGALTLGDERPHVQVLRPLLDLGGMMLGGVDQHLVLDRLLLLVLGLRVLHAEDPRHLSGRIVLPIDAGRQCWRRLVDSAEILELGLHGKQERGGETLHDDDPIHDQVGPSVLVGPLLLEDSIEVLPDRLPDVLQLLVHRRDDGLVVLSSLLLLRTLLGEHLQALVMSLEVIRALGESGDCLLADLLGSPL